MQDVACKWKDQTWRLTKDHGSSNRVAPSSEYHQDNGLIIKNGGMLSAASEDADIVSTKSESHLLPNTYDMFVKDKETLQESA